MEGCHLEQSGPSMTKEMGDTSELLGSNVLGGSRGVLVCGNGSLCRGSGLLL